MIYSQTERTIVTDRLLLRLFNESDAKNVTILCNNYNVCKSTLSLPYPYPLECALSWIADHEQNFELDRMYEFAITDKNSGQLYGAIGISNHKKDYNGEMGYWIGEEHWGNGYATEAAKAIIEFVFKEKNYHRVYARHFKSNPASGNVMKKCGMTYEGTLKEHVCKEGSFEDMVLYGIINPMN
ncbi:MULTISPECIES: GNAT family N-acetyltransferase [unclassified Paenibacillus]|uniref:GNAT family N-acetyltransferase n=1 Tax=unclassified Paenibacillus TaxID=185978 RepID=UPI001C11D947|nr:MULTISPECIES: GNAT family N-acetyltransferase [unclassified Paenibacillus]MBU5443256.1 GNAT family N-acetyltransferase [Paenibacillus sp. MSJ-34]CAH0121935.1 [Ribosomal protein S5]-alanine N-acetyltransferase [Paenibacillus sp. CECT 9249]